MVIRRRFGKGYKLGPHAPTPPPADAQWLTAPQVRRRYGDRSLMWLWNKDTRDPDFPKPRYDGRVRMYSAAALDEYDRTILDKSVTPKMKNPVPRNELQRKIAAARQRKASRKADARASS